jgi:hypothetical protein
MSSVKITAKNSYNQSKVGIWGTLGNGAGCKVHFIQLVLEVSDIQNIKLVSEIPDSRNWKIKDLFQRNINKKRVEESIIPYLEDKSKIKFFNPITLILVPLEDGVKIIQDIPFLKSTGNIENYGLEFAAHEHSPYYRISFEENLKLGQFEWDQNKCAVVAIDGQHRLSALKNLQNSGSSTFNDWTIPAVLLCIHKENEQTLDLKLIEAVRRIFIDINNKAEQVNPIRKILLNDTSVLDVVSQEIIEFSHNAITGNKNLPLYFINWRGDSDLKNSPCYSHLIDVQEINNLLKEYFDLPVDDGKNLPIPNWLSGVGLNKGELTYTAAENLRKFVHADFVQGFHVFLLNIKPYSDYLHFISNNFSRTLDGKYSIEKDSYGSASNYDVDKESFYHSKFKDSVLDAKKSIPKLLTMEIGIRAIIYVYSKKDTFEEINKTKYSWSEYAATIAPIINKLIKHKWFDDDPKNLAQQKQLLGIVRSNSNNEVINYRIDQVPESFGAFIFRLCLKFSGVNSTDQIVSDLMDSMKNTQTKDIKKKVRAEKSPTWNGSPKDLTKYVNDEARKESDKKIKELETFITKYEDFEKKYN